MKVEDFLSVPGIITLCGSTRFYEAYVAANRLLTNKGWVVLSCGQFGHSYHSEVAQENAVPIIKALHFAKIMMSDAICVVNAEQYLGKSTRLEQEFAELNGRAVITFEHSSLHDGVFQILDAGDFEVPDRLSAFTKSFEWQDFVSSNPDYY